MKQQWWRAAVVIVALLVTQGASRPAAAQDDVTWLLGQINALRGSLGLPSYVLNPQLSAAANMHSRWMADNCTVTHFWPDGTRASDRARASGYTGGWISENIYGGQLAQASDAWNFWINSPVHYQGLTHPIVNEIGIGVAASDCGQYYTLVFGQRDAVNPPPAPAPASESESAASVDSAPDAFPTPVPYVPPTATFTPTPTIPTLTPSATWTITPTHTESPTPSVAPPTATPLVLPTVPALDTGSEVSQPDAALDAGDSSASNGVAVAAAASPTHTSTPTPTRRPSATPSSGTLNLTGTAASDSAIHLRDLIPVALALQIGLILLAVAMRVWRRE